MQIQIEKDYLWLPVDMSQEEVKLNIYDGDEQIHEISIRLGEKKCDFYGALRVSSWRGRTLRLQLTEKLPTLEERAEEKGMDRIVAGRNGFGRELNSEAEVFGLLRQEDERPENPYPYRPKLHYTPAFGWVNDPNGLVYANGTYHLFYQYNPYSTAWENMSWGHAVSDDLFDWKEEDVALEPDRYGVAYSGCGFLDKRDDAGFGKDALLFYYTAAGGRNEWSLREGNRFEQRLMVSNDNAKTMRLTDKGVIPWMAAENRDPKIFYHEQSGAYVMILYLAGNDFLILRSTDLLHWENTQHLNVPGMWECPVLVELPVEDETEKKWVFWSADGYYQVGHFDGYRFEAESERCMAYCSRKAYAAQTYDNTQGRTVIVPWLRLANTRGNYCGAMGLPMEMRLRRRPEGLRIAFDVVKEMDRLRGDREELTVNQAAQIGGEPRELSLVLEPNGTGEARLAIGETVIRADLLTGKLQIDTKHPHTADEKTEAEFDPAEGLRLRVVIDQEVLELLGSDGLICGAFETEENVLGKTVSLQTEAPVREFCWYELKTNAVR